MATIVDCSTDLLQDLDENILGAAINTKKAVKSLTIAEKYVNSRRKRCALIVALIAIVVVVAGGIIAGVFAAFA